jgi:hypothetical protein
MLGLDKASRRVDVKMVVVHRAYGYRFVIYTGDHEPAHVHIAGAGHAKSTCLDMAANPKLSRASA